ncbi:MAG TPA: hypothetical protein VL463_27335 [Kofleriaceae bacterium]|jgi:hypothetical protein|nr:hypothetical protein [Kofleriaceae bacterium]
MRPVLRSVSIRLAFAPLAAIATFAACSYTSYTPPSRMMPLETALAPAPNHTDLQAEGSMAGAVMGFGTWNGALRLREGLDDNVAVTAEGGVMNVDGHAAAGTEHNAYMGRIGVHLHQRDRTEGPHVALTAGVGGGWSALAGRWVTQDVAVIVSGNGAWVVPFASLEGFASQPIDPQLFQYRTGESSTPRTDVLTRTAGFRVTAGLEFRDGSGIDSRASFLIGMMMGGIEKPDDGDMFMGLGAALRLSW